jgi:hypothetical protein
MVAVGGWIEERQGGLEEPLLLHQLQTLGEKKTFNLMRIRNPNTSFRFGPSNTPK